MCVCVYLCGACACVCVCGVCVCVAGKGKEHIINPDVDKEGLKTKSVRD